MSSRALKRLASQNLVVEAVEDDESHDSAPVNTRSQNMFAILSDDQTLLSNEEPVSMEEPTSIDEHSMVHESADHTNQHPKSSPKQGRGKKKTQRKSSAKLNQKSKEEEWEEQLRDFEESNSLQKLIFSRFKVDMNSGGNFSSNI